MFYDAQFCGYYDSLEEFEAFFAYTISSMPKIKTMLGEFYVLQNLSTCLIFKASSSSCLIFKSPSSTSPLPPLSPSSQSA